jgi:hypothetical protein
MSKTNYEEYIENNTLRCEASYRGGGIEIGLNDLLQKDQDNDEEDFKMTAYQNYLGGGLLGRVCHSYNFDPSKLSKKDQAIVEEVTEALKKYYHGLTNHDGDEWEETTFEQDQARPASAY